MGDGHTNGSDEHKGRSHASCVSTRSQLNGKGGETACMSTTCTQKGTYVQSRCGITTWTIRDWPNPWDFHTPPSAGGRSARVPGRRAASSEVALRTSAVLTKLRSREPICVVGLGTHTRRHSHYHTVSPRAAAGCTHTATGLVTRATSGLDTRVFTCVTGLITRTWSHARATHCHNAGLVTRMKDDSPAPAAPG